MPQDADQLTVDAHAVYERAFEYHGVIPVEDVQQVIGDPTGARAARATAKLLEDGVAEIRPSAKGRPILHLISPVP